jgi:plastocyanin
MRSPVRLATVITAAVLAAQCGSGGGGSSYSGSPTAPTATGTPPATSGSASTVTITIRGQNGRLSFDPNPATVPSGQTVIWRNADSVVHRVLLDDRSVDTGDILPGASSPPAALGGISKPYHCSLHPAMVGSLNGAATPDPPEECPDGYC